MRQLGQEAHKAVHSPRMAGSPLPSQDATRKSDEKIQKTFWRVELRATENERPESYLQTTELGSLQEHSVPEVRRPSNVCPAEFQNCCVPVIAKGFSFSLFTNGGIYCSQSIPVSLFYMICLNSFLPDLETVMRSSSGHLTP